MPCRNCKHELNSDCRYCPRCGAPASLGWPVAGGPWLRRPAAVIGLGVLLAAWLLALQRAIRVNRPPAGREIVVQPARPTSPSPQRADKAPLITERPAAVSVPIRPIGPTRATGSGPSGARSGRAIGQPERVKPPVVRVERHAATARAQPAAPQDHTAQSRTVRIAAVPDQYRVRYRGSPPPTRPERKPVGVRPIGHRGIRVAAWRGEGTPERTQMTASAAFSPWRIAIVAARYHPTPLPPLPRSSGLIVHVRAQPQGVPTFVYYNAGRILGTAPLDVRFDRPGRYRLTFWTPSIRGRATRWVTVGGNRPLRLAVVMGSSREIARLQ
jgi:hypothetical protein